MAKQGKRMCYVKNTGVKMRKYLFAGVCACFVSGVAVADCKYMETENVTVIEEFDFVQTNHKFNRPIKKYRPVVKKQQKLAEPVKLKTHTEVVEYYQVLQPVTVYKPIGTEVKRYVVPARHCDRCEM